MVGRSREARDTLSIVDGGQPRVRREASQLGKRPVQRIELNSLLTGSWRRFSSLRFLISYLADWKVRPTAQSQSFAARK